MKSDTLKKKLRHLPSGPGVYLFRDADGGILYIGKAKSLRARVRGHFNRDPRTSPKNREMIRRVGDVETIVVGSEVEALLLEANLIKEHRPRFNIQLRDDKRYPYIKVTVQEPFPRIFVTRRLVDDGARYFGPYTDVGPMRQALELVKRLYTVRSCRYDLPDSSPDRPCLDYHIGLCRAPCVGLQSRESYRAMTDEILDILGGRTAEVRARVRREMDAAAEALDFERAATLRDALAGLDVIDRRQRALDVRGGDQDVFGIARDGDHACAVLLRIRAGKLLGREALFFENLGGDAEAGPLGLATTRLYFGRGEHGTADPPREVLFPTEFDDRELVERMLSEAGERKVRTHVPRRGDKRRLVELADQNARHLLEEKAILTESADRRADDVLYELQDALALNVVPRLIVCFDISHTQGTEVVGSAVVFRNGEPAKDGYRRFRVRGERADAAVAGHADGPGNDDVGSMAEVVGRYFRRGVEEGSPLPELAVIDGGKAQLNAAVAAARRAGAADVAFCGLAKREEAVYLVGRAEPLRLSWRRPALRLLQRVRDEAHRFAHTYNRKLRRRRTLTSELSEIPGIGATRQRALLRRFGSVRAIRGATEEDIMAVPGFSRRLAGRVLAHLHPRRADADRPS